MTELLESPLHIFIDSGVEIPTDRQAAHKPAWNNLKSVLPFGSLRIGDSFGINPRRVGTDQIRAQNYLSGAACAYRKTRDDGWNFTTRQMPDGTVRVWRLA